MDLSKVLELQKKAMEINSKLENTEIEAESNGLVIWFDARMNCLNVYFENTEILKNEKKLTESIKECINKGIKKSQELAAEQMQGIMGDLWLNLDGLKQK